MYSTAKYTTLSNLVYEYINLANLTEAHFDRLWAIGYKCAEFLNLDIFNEIVTRKINKNPNNTVTIPGDCIKITKLGVLNDSGEVATLTENDDMTAYADLYSDRLSLINDNRVEDEFSILNNYYINFWDRGSCFNLFGIRSGTYSKGDFKIDQKNGVILLNAQFDFDYVIMEMIVAPSRETDVFIPTEAGEAVIAYLGWKDIQFLPQSRRSNTGEKVMRQRNYWNERRLAKMRINPITLWGANDVVRLSGTLAAKG